MISQQRLHDLFDYQPDGGLVWKEDRRGFKVKGKKAGTLSSNGYEQVCVDCRTYRTHRLVWMFHFGLFPPDDIDHINGDRRDNRIENLRCATRDQNMQNQRKAKSDNISGYLGVSYHKRCNRYFSRIQVDGKQISCGYFKTPEEAHAAYLRKKAEVHSYQTIL